MSKKRCILFLVLAISISFINPASAHSPKVEQALTLLVEGNQRYRQGLNNPDLTAERREALVAGQRPFAVIIGCSDSRVPPEHVFDQGLGDLFVIRLAGNVVDDLAIGSVEYAVAELAVPLVVVLGHTDCGAVKAAVRSTSDDSSLSPGLTAIVRQLEPAMEKVMQEKTENGKSIYEDVADANVKEVMERLVLQSAIIEDAVQDGDLAIVGAKHHADGKIIFFP